MIRNETFILSSGLTIPKIGYGTWQIKNEDAPRLVKEAIQCGYRHIDTAIGYNNEIGVGEGIRASGIKREDLFITSKIPDFVKSYEEAKQCIENSLKRLGLEYLDLMLIHTPRPWDLLWDKNAHQYYEENVAVYKAMEEAYEAGKLKHIGISNFQIHDIENILANCKIKPHVNQICVFIGETPFGLIEYCKDKGILVEAYSPVGTGRLLKNERVIEMANKYGVSVAQLGIRYCLELGTLPLPKSSSLSHMENNLDVDFEIQDKDMKLLKEMTQY